MRNFLQKHIFNWLMVCLFGLVMAVSGVVSVSAASNQWLLTPTQHFAQADNDDDEDAAEKAKEEANAREETRRKALQDTQKNCPAGECIITDYVNPAIKALAFVTGVFVVLSIVLGGIQYSISTDDAQKVSAAKDRITKAIIAFLMFLLLYAFLDYIIPGGVGQYKK